MGGIIKILLVDDNQRFREHVKDNLKIHPVEVLGEAVNGVDALRLLNRVKPDIILLDLEMPVMNGSKTYDRIKEIYAESNVIIISNFYDDIISDDFKTRGAKGFISKEMLIDNLLFVALKKVNDGGQSFHNNSKKDKPKFTNKQLEILPHIFEGKTNKEIACVLEISERTVERRRTKIYLKSHVNKKIDFYKYAFTRGLQFIGDRQKRHE